MRPRLREAVDRVLAINKVTREAGHPPEANSAFRRKQLQDDPLAWAVMYLSKHLTLEDGTISLSPIHEGWIDRATAWGREPGRDILIAPRGTGKSTWHFLILVLWAAATERVRFVAAFSDSATQAEGHLQTVRNELERNPLLRADYPDLCRPAKRFSGATVADNRGMLHTRSGFAFAARGIDSGTLGLKVDEHRPDLIVMDDVEPGASRYSAYLAEKRLSTILDVILPMGSANARTVLVGTTTMTGSIVHQAVMHEAEPAQWIKDEGFSVHHDGPFDDDGESIWPERWSTDWLRGQVGSAAFAKNFLNMPRVLDGEYWQESDFRYGTLPSASRRVITVDPAVTTQRSSDETGIAVVSYSAAHRKACVDYVTGVRMKGEPLRGVVLGLIARYPDVAEVVIERNQGGDLMKDSVFHSMPVPVRGVHSTERKELRFERLLGYYRRGVVLHAERFPQAEAQMTEFPRGLHDDQPDAISLAIDHLNAQHRSASNRLRQAVR